MRVFQTDHLSHADRIFFDKHNGIHPVTKMRLEDGSGCHPIGHQVERQLRMIEWEQGAEAAAAIRAQLGLMK